MRARSSSPPRCRTLIGAALLGAALAMTAWGQTPAAATDLEGTAWELVKIEGTDARIHVPAERGHYLLAFTPHGELSARIDCNRGSGTWSSPEAGRLVLGPLASTRTPAGPYSARTTCTPALRNTWAYARVSSVSQGSPRTNLASFRKPRVIGDPGNNPCPPIPGRRPQSNVFVPGSNRS